MRKTETEKMPTTASPILDNNRLEELKSFDESKSGVKGIVDGNITKIPPIFIRPLEELACDDLTSSNDFTIPVIDMQHLTNIATSPGSDNNRAEVVENIRRACEVWGCFQLVNHGIPIGSLNEMLDAARAFHEQPAELKAQFYSREHTRRVRYGSNLLYKTATASWRDTLTCIMSPGSLDPSELPAVCRDANMEFSDNMLKLGLTLFELLSEVLGLKPNHLENMDCAKGHFLLSHYYPSCPEPELTMGTSKHTDPCFLTILLQDQIGGLQFFHQNKWVEVPPIEGALVVNIGDFLQLMSNDKFVSKYHRVVAKNEGPRISVACLFFFGTDRLQRLYGPIKELLSDENPAVYQDTTLENYFVNFLAKEVEDFPNLEHLKI